VTSEEKYVYISKNVGTPIALQVLGTPHEALLPLFGIKYSTDHPDLFVDIVILTEGLTRE